MVKKMISGFLALLLILCAFSPAAYADDEHQHTFGEVTDTVDTKGLKLPNGQDFPVNVSITKSPCSTPGISCGKVLYSWNFGGRGGSFVDDKDLPVAEVIKRWYEWNERFYGNNVGFTQFQAGGGSASPGGVGRNPSGYAGEGVPNYNSDGELQLVVYPQIQNLNFKDTNLNGYKDSFSYTSEYFLQTYKDYTLTIRNLTDEFRGVRVIYYNRDSYYNSRVLVYRIPSVPVDGYYYFGFNNVRLSSDYKSESSKSTYIKYSGSFSEHLSVSSDPVTVLSITSSTDSGIQAFSSVSIKFYPIVVNVIPDTVNVKNQTNITINNNTFNGNIYVDSSNKLTYIYPQYTTVNENNETVTNISNNPIIYNEETKQYYTYDQTTNNYYYITYGDPAPTPTPSPSPDPGGSGGGDNPSGGGSSGGGSSGGGSGNTPSGGGSNWWEKLLDKLGSALIDGLLDAIKGILKLLFDLISSILGWIIWLCSKVFDLFPFLPPGVGALLVGGVVVCFILAFIKFIRG